MAEHAIGPLSQIPKGEGRVFKIAAKQIAVFHTRGGAVFATQAQCPHLSGPLADGLLDEATIVCPLHDRIFELSTGKGIGTDCAIEVFASRVNDHGVVMVAV